MYHFSGLINKNYGWELAGFYKIGKYKESTTFFDLHIEWIRCKLFDHTPRFEFQLTILNCNVVEFNIYNIWHRDDEGNLIKPDGTPIEICNDNLTYSI